MSDTYRRYRAIKLAIMQFYQPQPTRHREKHLNTLVALMCGLVGAKSAHLSSIADHAPSNGADQESVIVRFRRWLKHTGHMHESWFLPIAKALLTTLAQQPLQLVMDGSVVGRGCLALMVSVVYHGRALPLAWVVIKAKKGHFPQDTHCALLAQVSSLLPPDAHVTFLGDGEFDGCQLQAALRQLHWHYVCRTASTICITAAGSELHVAELAPKRGELLAVTPAWVTAHRYGPVAVLAIWEHQYAEPLSLTTNMEDVDAAYASYRKRPHIETFFSDLKSRGFQMHTSHLCDPARVSRLLLASCLAYLWVVYLGVCALEEHWRKRLHRSDRCDVSLFRLRLRLLARCLKDLVPLPPGFLVPAILPVAEQSRPCLLAA